jgi:nicotinamide mononucleotide (NMN) deamidase PncC
MSKVGQIHQTITELYEGGSSAEEVAKITGTSEAFVESVIRHKDEKKELLAEIDFENTNKTTING